MAFMSEAEFIAILSKIGKFLDEKDLDAAKEVIDEVLSQALKPKRKGDHYV